MGKKLAKDMLRLKEAVTAFVEGMSAHDLSRFALSFKHKLIYQLEGRTEEAVFLAAVFKKGLPQLSDYEWAEEVMFEIADLRESIVLLDTYARERVAAEKPASKALEVVDGGIKEEEHEQRKPEKRKPRR